MNKLILIASLLSFSTFSFGATVQFGRIVEVKGSAFISYNGQTHEVKKGETIFANSELIVEQSGQVSFTDNADHRFFLGSSSTVGIYPTKVELRSGDIWVQSLNRVEDYQLTSANATVNYQGGEAIFSYDSVKGKSQLMVINGLMKLSNLRSPELNLSVAEGNFSFVDPSFEEGMPRDPTPVGSKTYSQLVSIFPGVAPMDKNSAEIFKDKTATVEHAATGSRGIASVNTNELEEKYKAELLNDKKMTTTVAKIAVKKKTVTPNANKLVVKIYGLVGSETSATTAIYDIPNHTTEKKRAPASVEVISETVLDQAVPQTENMNTIPTTPHYKESDKLIDQLNKI